MSTFPVTQIRNGDSIEFFFSNDHERRLPIAWLDDGADDFIIDEMGQLCMLKIGGDMPQDWTLPVTVAEARAIDAARIPDINL